MRRFFRFIIFKWWVAKVERKALSPEFESRDGEVFSCSSLLKSIWKTNGNTWWRWTSEFWNFGWSSKKFLSHLEWAFSVTQQLHTSRSNPKFISISTFPLADNEPTENLIWVAKLPSQLEFYQMFTRVRQVI